MTGMRRNEVLGLKWPDLDFHKQRLALNRGLVAVGYEVHQTRGKTKSARRNIDLDDTTLTLLSDWRAYQTAEFAAVGITNTDNWVWRTSWKRMTGTCALRARGSLLIKEGVPVTVVSERLRHATIAHTIQIYQHLLPGMPADAARTYPRLARPVP
jgi:integrase